MKTVTRLDVAEAIYTEVGLSRKDSNEILDMIVDEIVKELSLGTLLLKILAESSGLPAKYWALSTAIYWLLYILPSTLEGETAKLCSSLK